MRRRAARGKALAATFGLVLGAILALLSAREAAAGLAILQRSNGLPGTGGASEEVPQKLFIGGGGFRIAHAKDPDARYLIVRLDREVVWEVDPRLDEYVETTFAHFRMQREEAERDREQARQAALRKLSGDELERWLRTRGLRRDGSREVTTVRGPRESTPDGASRQRVEVRLNGVTQVAVWQTDRYQGKYTPPKELIDFYDRMGAFPSDVTSAARAAFDQFPERIVANIDMYAVATTIETTIDAVGAWPEDLTLFAEPDPKRFRKVSEFSKEKLERRTFTCAVCGKEVDAAATPFYDRDPETKEKLFFDTEEHWIQFQTDPKRARAGAKKPGS